ncbi:MAG: substrate-binding domain-containing protein [Hyphomicrobiales bacterium]|nr:substrate-binding domain-containing protein [Hyphomicrobiales bacterium]MBV8827117.1 substrate-binding domain-containing protein [Hyphomicrobiales bacterium]MBV9426718.1 substrate-binding domain-containing protein [Bradyrhizobiaceae bacterium]
MKQTAIAAAAFAALVSGAALAQDANKGDFRVCADPNNLPFSNRSAAGFENKIAELIAGDLGKHLTVVWHPQRRAFVRHTLKADLCDVIMGVPASLEMVATTRPYYRSRYVFVYRSDRGYGELTSIRDPRLKHLSIGVQLIGDDGYNTPPAHALSEQGIVTNLVGYTVYGDYREPNPPARIIDAVANGTVDIAAVWGPLAGYFAARAPVPLTITPITDTVGFEPLRFEYDIAVGVRKDDGALKDRIDAALDRHRADIERLLNEYRVPLVVSAARAGH